MISYKVGQNFKFENHDYKIVNITNVGIECINMKNGQKRIFKFLEFTYMVKHNKIVLK